MDVNKLFKTIYNLNDYISATQEVINKHSNSKVQFNMSSVISLKKIRSLEIEYFNKCDESGAGIKILDLMLRLPPSKTWSLLGKELVVLMQYWLEAIRKHLIKHNNHWWNFLSTLLKFIQEICSKHTVLPNIVVQDLSECLLDLSTNPQLTVIQRIKLLQCYNSACAESSREIRYALKNKFEHYFVKLSSILPSCGDMRAQYSMLETLLRWLLPRQDPAVKIEAATKWFPQCFFSETARKIFIERPWQNFFKDAREFLNEHNMSSDLITTIIIRKFYIGKVTLISGTDGDYYLDLNTGTASLSLMLEGGRSLLLGGDTVRALRLHRDSSHLFISIDIMNPELLHPSADVEDKLVQVVVSSRSDLVKLNRALGRIFGSKYELLMDLENPPPKTPPREDTAPEQSRRSRDLLLKQRRSGCMVRPKFSGPWKSPSTASTSSLALLREKLTAFPGYTFDKEPVSVCALPQLSSVTEVTEEDRQSANVTLSTYKIRPHGVCNNKRVDRTSKRDEIEKKCTTPTNFDESSISCLLVATIGSNDSVINDTLERLPRDKEIHTDNIVELLAKEALQSNHPKLDNKIVIKEKNHSEVNSNIVQDTPTTKLRNENPFINSGTEVSSADVVEETQFVNDRQGIQSVSLPLKEKSTIDIIENKQTAYEKQEVDDFFSQHFDQNRNGDLFISPTIAKKINETSSESSLDFDIRTPMIVDIGNNEYNVNFDLDYTEIVECLNDMVDKVCEDVDECTEYLRVTQEIEHFNVFKNIKKNPPKTSLKEIRLKASPKATKKKLKKTTRKLFKQQNKYTKIVKSHDKNRRKLTESIKRMSTIVEKDSDAEKAIFKNSTPESNTPPLNDYETSLIKRKRKLYSPKDANAVNEKTGVHISETEDDYSILTETRIAEETPKTLATSYKDIEKIRRMSARNLRNRKSLINLSPRTKQNNEIFDKLKNTVEGEEKIILVDKMKNNRSKKLAVYNFSSDSGDDDFQIRKVSKKSISTVGSVESAKSTCAKSSKGRKVTSKEKNKEKKNKHVKSRKSKLYLKQKKADPGNDMIDERIREAPTEALNTSLVIEEQRGLIPEALEPILHKKPQMEIMEDQKDLTTGRATRRRKPTNFSSKKDKDKEYNTNQDNNVCSDKEQSVRSSPLPGLIIETVQVQIHKDPDDSLNVLEKYKDIYKSGALPDISVTNTTHNLLSDLEQATYDSNLNVTEEFNMIHKSNTLSKRSGNETLNNSPKAKKSKVIRSNVSEEIEPQIITLSEESDDKSDKSIATLGKSPITGHGDFDESPPNTDQLTQRYEPRGLETQDLNESIKDYFNKLTKDIYESSGSSHSEIISDTTVKAKELERSPMKLINKETTPNMSPTVSIMRLSPKEIDGWLAPRFNSVFGSYQTSETDQPVRITRSHTKSQDQKHYPNAVSTKSSKLDFCKSVISPIKMFDEVYKQRSVTPESNDYVEHIKNIMTKKSDNLKLGDTTSHSSRYNLRKYSSKIHKSVKTARSRTSTDFEYSNKTHSSQVFEGVKKENTGTIISDFESGHASSVTEWFNRNEVQKQSRAESVDLSLKDNLENIMEKLETTLTEIHYKTSKKFVSMFVDARKHLMDLKQRRRRLYEQTAQEVISDVVKITDAKFGELERRYQDLDQQFIDGLTSRSGDVMREDCNQKRAMVSLLKEDIQSVLNHINKGGRTNF